MPRASISWLSDLLSTSVISFGSISFPSVRYGPWWPCSLRGRSRGRVLDIAS